ncbi:MAG TPA: lysozyme inhibitor LprI family protein [Chthoniobacterales bacterium]|nr:lysozyme inhibitor LprI family protein [Chthoniobacterales bacterium]
MIAPNGDRSKVPPDFAGMIVNSEEEKEQELDNEMNLVYKAVRMLLPPAKFAKVKDDQVAWLKKRDATPAGQKSGVIIKRINALEEFLWN